MTKTALSEQTAAANAARRALLASLSSHSSVSMIRRVAASFPPLPSAREDVTKVTDAECAALDQRWLPAEFADIVRDLLAALDAPSGLRVFAPHVGRGLWLAGIDDEHFVTGIEADEDVAALARRVLPKAAILTDDAAAHEVRNAFDLVIGMPAYGILTDVPWSGIAIERKDGQVESHALWLYAARHACAWSGGIVAAVLPKDWKRKADEGTNAAVRGMSLLGVVPLRVFANGDATTEPDATHALYVYYSDRLPAQRGFAFDGAVAPKLRRRRRGSETLDNLEFMAAGAEFRMAAAHFRSSRIRWNAPLVLAPYVAPERATRVLPVTDAVEVRIIPNASHIALIPNGRQAAVRLASLHEASGTVTDVRRPKHSKPGKFSRFSELCREPWEQVGETITAELMAAGITPVMTQDQVTRLARRKRWIARMRSPFEQVVKDRDGEWGEAYTADGVRAACGAEYAQMRQRLIGMGFSPVAFPYQLDDAARLAVKNRALIGSEVGTGKSVTMVMYVCARGSRTNIITCQTSLIGKWAEELDKWQTAFPHLDLSYRVVDRLSDIGTVRKGRVRDFPKARSARFLLVAYESLWRIPRDSYRRRDNREDAPVTPTMEGREGEPKAQWHLAKGSLASVLRRVSRNATVIADECYKLSHEDAKVTQAVAYLGGTRRLPASATPIRNYVTNIRPVAKWVAGERSALSRHYSALVQGETEEFARDFATIVFYRADEETGVVRSKMVPRIGNNVAFRQMLAPLMLRRTKQEPDVRPFCPAQKPVIHRESIPMDAPHEHFYRELQAHFMEWWARYADEQRVAKKLPMGSVVLAKIAPLLAASAVPSAARLSAGGVVHYTGGVPAKARRVRELVDAHAAQDKVIVFVQTKDAVPMLSALLADFQPVVITGDVKTTRKRGESRSARNAALGEFKSNPARRVLIAMTSVMAEGEDVFQAAVGISYELSWSPAVDWQGIGRMLRPQQRKPVVWYRLTHSGSIDEYKALLSDAKQDAAEEGLDDAAFDLDVSGIPDIADYANALRTGLTIDQLRPTRRIAKVVMGRRIVWEAGESTEALADVLSDTAAPLTTRGRLAAPDVLAALEDADAAA